MAKQRFRDIKQKRTSKKTDTKTTQASLRDRLKAFVTDSFMLVMPLMYITFYLIFDGREGFATHRLAGWLFILIPLIIIQITFIIMSGQTPGMRAYKLRVVDARSRDKVPNTNIVLRQILTMLNLVSFGWITMFFRKDRRSLHELISGTTLIYVNDI